MLRMYFERIEEAIRKSDAPGSQPKFMIMDCPDRELQDKRAGTRRCVEKYRAVDWKEENEQEWAWMRVKSGANNQLRWTWKLKGD
jgi:hypothetical protein